jgi:hypothetical protein
MGNRTLGTDPFAAADTSDEIPGPIGVTPLKAGDRIVNKVITDWSPLTLETTPEISVRGKTLQDVADDLNTLEEWGGGGGSVTNDAVESGTSATVTVTLRGKFWRVLPTWGQYDLASPAAKTEWDRMVAALTIHEDRHVAIAVEEANKLAAELIGKEIGQIVATVNAMGRRLNQRQVQFDHDTNHGAKPGVKYGGVDLDTTIK